eukprot:2543065-Pleurochrysis_carterae.AAC.1
MLRRMLAERAALQAGQGGGRALDFDGASNDGAGTPTPSSSSKRTAEQAGPCTPLPAGAADEGESFEGLRPVGAHAGGGDARGGCTSR